MKTIFTLFASLLVSMSMFAADSKPKSALTIQSFDRGNLKVVIDGRRFETYNNYMRIQSMESGSHDVKIYLEKNSGIFGIFGSRYEVVFNSCIVMKPFTEMIISVDRFGRTSISEIRTKGRFDRDDRRGYDDRGKGWNDDDDHDFDFDHSDQYGDYDKGRDGKDYNDYGFSRTMNDVEFNRVLDCIQKEWIETNKMRSATQIISTNYFTSAQVKQMLQLFSFESNKLELAKMAYTKTVDKQNYRCVSDVLWFNSSKDELARFIRDCH